MHKYLNIMNLQTSSLRSRKEMPVKKEICLPALILTHLLLYTLRPRIICRSIFWQCNMQFQTEVNEISLVVSPHSYQRIIQILG